MTIHTFPDGRIVDVVISEKGHRLLELHAKKEAGTITEEEQAELSELIHGKIN